MDKEFFKDNTFSDMIDAMIKLENSKGKQDDFIRLIASYKADAQVSIMESESIIKVFGEFSVDNYQIFKESIIGRLSENLIRQKERIKKNDQMLHNIFIK